MFPDIFTNIRQKRSVLIIGAALGFFLWVCFCLVMSIMILAVGRNANSVTAPPVLSSPIDTNLTPSPTASLEITASQGAANPTLADRTPSPVKTPLPTATPSGILVSGSYCIPNQAPIIGMVVDIVDGDTIKVLVGDETYTVQYIGIDAPENITGKEYYGQEATDKNAEFVSGKQVLLYKDVSETDQTGHLLRYVVVDDEFVNLRLIQQGFARADKQLPGRTCANLFASAEQKASSAALGLWGIPPTVVDASSMPVSTAEGDLVSFFDNNSDGKVTCSDFQTQAEAQKAYDAGITKLDGSDKDGRVCETLP